MIKNKIGICTLYSGYNYGSALQAFAIKRSIENLGYCAEIINLNKSSVKGRNIYFSKIFKIGFRFLLHPIKLRKPLRAYFESPSNFVDNESKNKFNKFYDEQIQAINTKKRSIKKDNYLAFVSGSDQIWNSETIYIDKKYYLRFAPKELRIAYAPSFGRDFIANYNVIKISKYISEYAYLSIREKSGQSLIHNHCNREVDVLCDPTFLLSSEEWSNLIEKTDREDKIVLSYFLGEISEGAKKLEKELSQKYNLQIVSIPYNYEGVGPIEFINLISRASYVLTDSYHGTIFSIIFNKEFFVFDRNYKSASKQSTRILELLGRYNLLNRFNLSKLEDDKIDFEKINKIIEEEKRKGIEFLKQSFTSIGENMKNGTTK